MKRKLTVLATSLFVFLFSAVVAFAANPSGTPGQGGGAQGEAEGGGGLPFTGLNLALIVLGAVALLAVGVALRRSARSR